MENKKNISEVVIITLLLLVGIGILVSFQLFGLNFLNLLYDNTEDRTNEIQGIIIEEITFDDIYVKNTYHENIDIEEIELNEHNCSHGTFVELTFGVNRVNISECSHEISDEIKNVTLVTKKGIVVKKKK